MVRDTTDNSKESRPITTVARSLLRAVPGSRCAAGRRPHRRVMVLIAGSVAVVPVPGLQVRVVAPSLDLVLDTVTTLVTLAVAVLGWIRFRQRNEPVALVQAPRSSFSIASTAALGVVVSGARPAGRHGARGARPGPLYMFMLARLFAAGLLVVGGVGRPARPTSALAALRRGGSALVIIAS